MTAVRKGNNWVLNGTKTFCTNGHYADVVVVIAVTDQNKPTLMDCPLLSSRRGLRDFVRGKKRTSLACGRVIRQN